MNKRIEELVKIKINDNSEQYTDSRYHDDYHDRYADYYSDSYSDTTYGDSYGEPDYDE